MKLTALSVDGFKNLKGVSLIPDPSYNLILGENAQGKTNLLEAIWTLTGCRSFRGTRERDYLPFSGGNLQVEAKFQDARREQSVRLCMGFRYRTGKKDLVQRCSPEKQCPVFRVPLRHIYAGRPLSRRGRSGTAADVSGLVQCPAARPYAGAGAAVSAGVAAAKCCAETTAARRHRRQDFWRSGTDSWNSWAPRSPSSGASTSGGWRKSACRCTPRSHGDGETVSLHYQSSVFGKDAQDTLPETRTPELVQQYGEKMRQSRSSDLLLGHTASGAHRDDLLLAIDGKPAKEFGSQGQKKSLALALKLAQAEIYSKRRKESPVVLLDDVMGELDEARQAVVSTIVQEMQVFVTTCHPESLLSPKNGKRFLLKDGMLTGDVENRPETA